MDARVECDVTPLPTDIWFHESGPKSGTGCDDVQTIKPSSDHVLLIALGLIVDWRSSGHVR